MLRTIIANVLKCSISLVIMLGVTLALFEIFPMENTKANHDMMMILVGLVLGGLAFAYMEHCKMFEKKVEC